MVSRPRHGLSLCAGGGGLDLGVMLAEPGFHTRAFVEWEGYPRTVLIAAQRAGYFATLAIWDDLRSFDQPSVRRLVDGLAHQSRAMRLLGNGVHPLAAAHAWRALSAANGPGPLDLATGGWVDQPSADEPFRRNTAMTMQGRIARAGGTKVKRSMSVQAALEWAFRVEQAQLELPPLKEVTEVGLALDP